MYDRRQRPADNPINSASQTPENRERQSQENG